MLYLDVPTPSIFMIGGGRFYLKTGAGVVDVETGGSEFFAPEDEIEHHCALDEVKALFHSQLFIKRLESIDVGPRPHKSCL